MTSGDTVRDFFRFLTEQRITHLKMASGRYGEVEEPGANAVSYPGAITKSRNGSHGGHGGHGVIGGLAQTLRRELRLFFEIERGTGQSSGQNQGDFFLPRFVSDAR